MLNAFRRRGDRDRSSPAVALQDDRVLNAFRRRGDRDTYQAHTATNLLMCSTPFGDEAIGTIR